MRCVQGMLLFLALHSALQAQDFLGRQAPDWLAQLDSKDAALRRSAAFALGKLGDQGAIGVAKLTHLLDDSDPAVAETAAFALGELGGWSKPAIPDLLRIIEDKQKAASFRRGAIVAVGRIGKDSTTGVAALLATLDDADAGVRQNAAWALGRLKAQPAATVVAALQTRLADDDDLVRRDAAAALAAFAGEARPALADLFARLKEEKRPVVRRALLATLVNLVGPQDRDHAATLKDFLDGQDAEAGRSAALALGNIGGPPGTFAVPVLRGTLRDPNPLVRRQAAAALGNLGSEAAPAVDDLLVLLADAEPALRMHAAIALARIGPAAEPAIPALVKLATAKEPAQVRLYALEALSRIGKGLDAVVPDLIRLLKEETEPTLRQRVVWALGRVSDLEGSAAAAALEAVLAEKTDEMVVVRYESARYLALKLGPKAPDQAIDVLAVMLFDSALQVYTRTEAQVTSGGAENAGSATAKPVIGGDGRYLPCLALAEVGPRANRPAVIRGLEAAAQSSDVRLKEAAQDALKKIRPPDSLK